ITSTPEFVVLVEHDDPAGTVSYSAVQGRRWTVVSVGLSLLELRLVVAAVTIRPISDGAVADDAKGQVRSV
nr:hypothetical protein [Micromonospora sp. DSM 115978]